MKKLLLASAICASTFTSGAFAQSINDLEVNKYDCSVQEVIDYMNKRTSSLKRDTGIATWGDFKENAVYITSASEGGNPPDEVNAGESTPNGVNSDEEGLFAGCPTFNTPDIDWSLGLDSFGSLPSLPSFDNPLAGLQDALNEKIQELIDQFKEKGFCERLNEQLDDEFMDSLNERASEYADSFRDDALEELDNRVDGILDDQTGRDLSSWTGSDVGDIADGDVDANIENNIINNALSDSSGNSGKLLNVYDERLDDNRERAKEKEIERQEDKLTDRILGR
jgi:hypothetical protein